jgi:hypothetical protein
LRRTIVGGVAAVLLCSGSGWCASIGMYATPDCMSSQLTLPSGETRTIYIRLDLTGFDFTECSGAMFRIVGLPAGWLASWTANPIAEFAEDPFSDTGANMGFSSPLGGTCTDLYTVQLTATTEQENVVLQVTAVASDACPWVHSWCYTPPCKYGPTPPCITAGAFFINCSHGCPVSVRPSTWAGLKKLYQ